jgi:hypothetical protein
MESKPVSATLSAALPTPGHTHLDRKRGRRVSDILSAEEGAIVFDLAHQRTLFGENGRDARNLSECMCACGCMGKGMCVCVVDLSVVDLIKIRVFVCLKFGSGLVGIIGWVVGWVNGCAG